MTVQDSNGIVLMLQSIDHRLELVNTKLDEAICNTITRVTCDECKEAQREAVRNVVEATGELAKSKVSRTEVALVGGTMTLVLGTIIGASTAMTNWGKVEQMLSQIIR